MAAMLVFKLLFILAMGYARGQTLEKKANYEKSTRRNIEKHCLKYILEFRVKYFYDNFISYCL